MSANHEKAERPYRIIGVAIAIGAGIGVALGVTQDNVALGIGVGVALAAAIGTTSWRRSQHADPDRMTDRPREEQRVEREPWR